MLDMIRTVKVPARGSRTSGTALTNNAETISIKIGNRFEEGSVALESWNCSWPQMTAKVTATQKSSVFRAYCKLNFVSGDSKELIDELLVAKNSRIDGNTM